MVARITTREVQDFTTDRIAFVTNGSLRGEWEQERYVVYSYNAPIFCYDREARRWFENSHYHGYSPTTSRHYGAARPRGEVIVVDDEDIDLIRRRGAAYALAEQFAGGAA